MKIYKGCSLVHGTIDLGAVRLLYNSALVALMSIHSGKGPGRVGIDLQLKLADVFARRTFGIERLVLCR